MPSWLDDVDPPFAERFAAATGLDGHRQPGSRGAATAADAGGSVASDTAAGTFGASGAAASADAGSVGAADTATGIFGGPAATRTRHDSSDSTPSVATAASTTSSASYAPTSASFGAARSDAWSTTSRSSGSTAGVPATPSSDQFSTIKETFNRRIFMGSYDNREYVEQMAGYRDIVRICDAEVDFKRDLGRLFRNPQDGRSLLNIVDFAADSSDIRMLVQLESEIPFGTYWFQIGSVRRMPEGSNRIHLRIKCLRPVSAGDERTATAAAAASSASASASRETHTGEILSSPSLESLLTDGRVAAFAIFGRFRDALSAENCTGAIRVTIVVVIVLFQILCDFLYWFGDFSIRFMTVAAHLIRVCTPFAMGCLELASRVIGGIFILVYQVWRDLIYGGRARGPPPQGLGYGGRQPPIAAIQYAQTPRGGYPNATPRRPPPPPNYGSRSAFYNQ